MTRARAAGILAGFILVGLMQFATLPAAGQEPPVLISNMYLELILTCYNSSDVAGCEVVAGLIRPFIENSDLFAEDADFQIEAVLGLPKWTTCEECIAAVASLEASLAADGTVKNIAETMHAACIKTFRYPSLQQQCESEIDQYVPQVADDLLETFPPVQACIAKPLDFCPP
jgi:hypothetical protein